MKWKNSVFFSILMCIPLIHNAQLHDQKSPLEHSPKKATILSAVIPGAGQIYNKSYWKVPVIYAGFAGLTYVASVNNGFYHDYKRVYDDYQKYYQTEINNNRTPVTDTLLLVRNKHNLSVHNVKAGRDFYRRRRDLTLIGIGSLYIINIIEAYVDAHMFSFDISDDLSVSYKPYMYYTHSLQTGFRFSIAF